MATLRGGRRRRRSRGKKRSRMKRLVRGTKRLVDVPVRMAEDVTGAVLGRPARRALAGLAGAPARLFNVKGGKRRRKRTRRRSRRRC